MASLSRLIKEKGGEIGSIKAEHVKVQQIHYTKLKESELNFYTRSEAEVMELADSMLIAGGILQPLIVRKTDMSEYEILSGHKRKRASVCNVERGYKQYEFLPCIVIDMGGLMDKKIAEKILASHDGMENDALLDMIAEYIVICTNSTASECSDYEKMMQAVKLAEILPAMLEDEELKGRALRAEIAKEMGCGNGQVGRYQSIYNNLIPEAMERFKEGSLSFSAASVMSGLDADSQKEALRKEHITVMDIEIIKSQRTVSNMDTEKAAQSSFNTPVEGDFETVSNMDTEKAAQSSFNTPVEGDFERKPEGTSIDSHMEYSESNLEYAFKYLFDTDNSNFPQDMLKELLNIVKNAGGNVSVLTEALDKILPFENEYIKLEHVLGYRIYFKRTDREMSVPLWPFWRDFMYRFDSRESEEAAEENPNETCESGASEGETAVEICKSATTVENEKNDKAYKVLYTPEDVQEIYEEQKEIMRIVEREKKYGTPTEADEKQYGKAVIIRDGLTYLLEAFKEGTIC